MTLAITNLAIDGILQPATFSVEPGQCLVVQGPSGGGKSTLLKAIAGLTDPGLHPSGVVQVDGRDVQDKLAEHRRIGLLFQRPLLFDHMTVGQNIAIGMHSESDRLQAVDQWLERVELPGFANRRCQSLSGGQQARVALARALANQPRALLLDEPFSALDPDLRVAIRDLTFRQLAAAQVPVVLVTHDHSDVPAQHLTPLLYQMRDGVLTPT